MDVLVTSDLDPSPGHGTPNFHSEALPYYEDATAGLDEAEALEAEVENATFDSESEEAELQRFQQRDTVLSSRRTQEVAVHLPLSTLQCPRTAYKDIYEESSSLTISKERKAVQSLLEADPTQKDDDFIELELDKFSCYIDSDRFPYELRALHTYATFTGKTHFYFDGVLRVGDVEHHVRRVPFEQIPLGNYGKESPTVGDQLWIRSKLNEKKEIYYQLRHPSREYARFHKLFVWVADLAKHVVDFFDYMIDQHRDVSIHHFREDFAQWLLKTHDKAPEFQRWYKQRGSDDFRQSIVANQAFIRKETFGTLGHKKLHRLQLFHEIAKPFDFYKPQSWKAEEQERPHPLQKGRPPNTIVTPYIRECFSGMDLGQLLKAIEPCMSTEERIRLSWPEERTTPLIRRPDEYASHESMIQSIQPGDLISTHLDPDDCNNWKPQKSKGKPQAEESREGETKSWYCLVQKVYTSKKGSRSFDIFWMYQPEDTPCCAMKYPYRNELFLSNHCTCHTGEGRIRGDEVTGIHAVEWLGGPGSTDAEFFVRQTYQHAQRRFVTLEKAHLRCRIEENPARKYQIGDSVLVLTPGTSVLEPHELLGYVKGDQIAHLRRLLRRNQIEKQDCTPNELVYTEEETYASVNAIHSKCIIRFYSPGEEVSIPYNLNGTGNAFFITHRKLSDGSLQPLGRDKPQLRQGFNPKLPTRKLRALDLYCGCGNLGRGLEDGGAVKAEWANDIWGPAVHTYMANVEDPETVKPFLGSVDDLLHYGLEGRFSDSVPRPGEVDLISGGSPCPGFSLITTDKTTMNQKKNRSLVASFAAFVDFYRPKYGLLENVTTIVQAQGSKEDFLSQLFCAIVGMGYQAQVILGDSWKHGSPQQRSRAFLWFAAPGLRLPLPPEPSHSHPSSAKHKVKGLGRITNGEAFMKREDSPTPFKFVSALEATSDLPDIYDAKPDTCIPFPDHRLSISISSGNMTARAATGDGKSVRTQMLNVPIRPYGMNFAKAWYGGTEHIPRDMFDHERDAFHMKPGCHRVAKISRGWGRVNPNSLFSTVTTFCHVTDARTGCWTHWDQPRPLTIMEVRRAQGIPDGEVLLGTPYDQWRLVGNAVARQMATALGLSLREAWVGTLYEQEEGEEEGKKQDETPIPGWEVEAITGDGEGTAGSSRSQTPGFRNASAPPGGVSSTPATSLPDVNDDLVAVHGVADGRKRPLPMMLADELMAVKKPRMVPQVTGEESGPEPGPEPDIGQSNSSDDDDVILIDSVPVTRPGSARWNGSEVVNLDDGHLSDGGPHHFIDGGDDDPAIPESAPVVSAPRPSGPTIVRLLSDDEEEEEY